MLPQTGCVLETLVTHDTFMLGDARGNTGVLFWLAWYSRAFCDFNGTLHTGHSTTSGAAGGLTTGVPIASTATSQEVYVTFARCLRRSS